MILWPPLRAWSVFPLTDSTGLALLIASLICAALVIERSPRWLVPWFLPVLALAFTRDLAFMPVIAAFGVLAVRRDRLSVALVGSECCGLPATPRPHGFGVGIAGLCLREPHDPHRHELGVGLADYPGNLGHMLGRYADYAVSSPLVVLLALVAW